MIPETKPLDPVEIESLFVPLDGSEWHERAISYAVLMSKWFGSTIDLFFSLADVPPLTRHGEWRQRAHLSLETPAETPNRSESIVNNGAIHEFGKILASDYLNEITSRMKHLGIDVETDLSAGSPAHILSHKAQQHDNSIIVMYARPQHRLYRYVRKKMAEELLFGKLAKGGTVKIGHDKKKDELTFKYVDDKPAKRKPKTPGKGKPEKV